MALGQDRKRRGRIGWRWGRFGSGVERIVWRLGRIGNGGDRIKWRFGRTGNGRERIGRRFGWISRVVGEPGDVRHRKGKRRREAGVF